MHLAIAIDDLGQFLVSDRLYLVPLKGLDRLESTISQSPDILTLSKDRIMLYELYPFQ
jgi:hypothetical protein